MYNPGREITPVTSQGTVVVNGQYDRRLHNQRVDSSSQTGYGKGPDSVFGIQKHELAFSSRRTAVGHRGLNDPELAVFTSLNGFPFDRDEIDAWKRGRTADAMAMLKDRLHFVGVNLTSYDPRSTLSNACSVAVAGSCTIFNTGRFPINIGDRVVWNLPPFNPSKNDKIRFEVEPYDAETPPARLSEPLVDGLKRLAGKTDVDIDQLVESHARGGTTELGTLFALVKNAYHDRDRFVIGTALQKAQPGDSFDLLLRYTHRS